MIIDLIQFLFHIIYMDYLAVSGASDEQLTELGPLRRGDLLSLRSFLNKKLRGESRDEKKRKLLDLSLKKGKTKEKESRRKSKYRARAL